MTRWRRGGMSTRNQGSGKPRSGLRGGGVLVGEALILAVTGHQVEGKTISKVIGATTMQVMKVLIAALS